MRLSTQQQGIVFALLAPFLYTMRSATIKSSPDLKIEQLMFSRYLFDLVVLSPFFFSDRNNLILKQIPLHTFRVMLIVLSAFCSIYGLRHLPLVDALLLENTMPLFVPLVLLVWKREKITRNVACKLLIGFCSLFFLLPPTLHISPIAAFASLTTGIASSMITVGLKTLSQTMSPITILFYSYVVAECFLFILCLFSWEGIPNVLPAFWFPFILNSLFGILFQYAVIRAYRLIPAHTAASFGFFGILFSAFLGWLIWREPIDLLQVIGGSLLIGSCLLVANARQRLASKEVLP